MKTPPIIKPIAQVLAELDAAYPLLALNAEIDRNWVWLSADLRGEHNKATREAIGRRGIGFQFAPNGHALPSGNIGTWAHHAEHPTRFKRKGKHPSTDGQPSTQNDSVGVTDADLLAVLT